MPARRKKIAKKKVVPPTPLVVMNPSKGLNNLVSPSLIDNREFSDLMNVEYDEGGVIRKRAGYVSYGGALTDARGLGIYATEATRYLVTVDNGTLRYNSSGAWTSATGATFSTGRDTTFTQARLKLFVWNGTDGGAYFDGSAVTRPGTMPKAKFSIYFQSYHIAAGVDGQPSRLYVSNISDATDFTVTTGGTQPQPDSTTDAENGITNVPGASTYAGTPGTSEARVFDVRKNDGDKITGLAIFQNSVIIFKERSIYQMTFDSSGLGTIVPITYATGCVSHQSIVAVENDLYFMSRQGLRVIGNEANYYNSIRTNVLSIRVQPTIDSINKLYFSRINAIYFDNKYIAAVPTSTSSIDRCVVYDRRFQAFTLWKSFNARSMVTWIDSNNKEWLYFIDDAGTQAYYRSPGTYADNGAAIEAWVTGKAQDAGRPDLTKFWVDWRPIFRSLTGSVIITIYSDDNTQVGTATIANSSTRGMGRVGFGLKFFGTDGLSTSTVNTFTDVPESIALNFNSRTNKFKIYNNTVNENFVLLGYVYGYYPKSYYVFDSSRKIYL